MRSCRLATRSYSAPRALDIEGRFVTVLNKLLVDREEIIEAISAHIATAFGTPSGRPDSIRS